MRRRADLSPTEGDYVMDAVIVLACIALALVMVLCQVPVHGGK